MFGRNERKGLNVTLSKGCLGEMLSYQYNAFYDFDGNLISENTTYFDLGISVGRSAVLGIGYHFEASISLSGIVYDFIEYIEQ